MSRLDEFRNSLHTVFGKKSGKRKLPAPVKAWLTSGALSIAGTVGSFLVLVTVAAGILFVVASVVSGPLQVVAAPVRAVGGFLGVSGEDNQDADLRQLHDELEKAAADDPTIACLINIPAVSAVNDPLYIGEVPEPVTTTVEGPDRKPRKVEVPVENAELVSDKPPVVAPGSQIIDGDGRPTDAVRGVLETVPENTPAAIARAYLVTALAGGTTGYDHFEKVASRALNGQPVTPDNAAGVAQAFFPEGTDLAPYYRVADGYVSQGMDTGRIRNRNGEGDFVYDRITECEDAVGAQKSADDPSRVGPVQQGQVRR